MNRQTSSAPNNRCCSDAGTDRPTTVLKIRAKQELNQTRFVFSSDIQAAKLQLFTGLIFPFQKARCQPVSDEMTPCQILVRCKILGCRLGKFFQFLAGMLISQHTHIFCGFNQGNKSGSAAEAIRMSFPPSPPSP